MSKHMRAVVFCLAICLVSSAPATPPYLRITSTPPSDLPSRNASQTDLAKFAWQEFLALNWKASIDSQNPPSPFNPRGTPDPRWNYSKPAPRFPNPVVWQTYAQTTELRPNSPLTTPWQNLGIPSYSYQTPIANGSGQNNLWNNLDEDNEIGSCDIYGRYTKQRDPKNLVLFQVKVNKDEYEYIRQNYGPDQNNPNGKLAAAQAQVVANITKPPYAYYGSAPVSTCNCPSGQAICLPCGLLPAPNSGLAEQEGAIEVKTAWRKLLPGESQSRFFTTTAIYYDINSSGQLAYYNDTFALVGMHIIHKTTKFPDFVFATFEQVDVEQSDAEYILLNKGVQSGPAVPIIRQKGQSNRTQMHPVPPVLDQVTKQVRQQLLAMNPSTVWQYYRLTGVEGASTDCPVNLNGQPANTANCVNYQTSTQCTTLNPNYYMANFMVESDPFLNNFSGPGFGKGGNPIFTGGCQNTVYANQIFDNGGCKGCHGVAQTAFGTDFSFLLDFGNNKPSIQPATIHYIPPQANSNKLVALKHYLDVLKP